MSRDRGALEEKIAAAQLRLVLDTKLGRTTPAEIRRLAELSPLETRRLHAVDDSEHSMRTRHNEDHYSEDTATDVVIQADTLYARTFSSETPHDDPSSSQADSGSRSDTFASPDEYKLVRPEYLYSLPKGDMLLAQLEQLLARVRTDQSQVTLVVLELANFSNFKEMHGQKQGDKLLATVAHRLRIALGDRDIIARFSSEQLAITVEHAIGTGESIAEILWEAAARPLIIEGKRYWPKFRAAWVTTDGNTSVSILLSRAERGIKKTPVAIEHLPSR